MGIVPGNNLIKSIIWFIVPFIASFIFLLLIRYGMCYGDPHCDSGIEVIIWFGLSFISLIICWIMAVLNLVKYVKLKKINQLNNTNQNNNVNFK